MIQYEDSIQESLRQSLRNLELDKSQPGDPDAARWPSPSAALDQVREVISQPPPPPQGGPNTGYAKQLGPTTADEPDDRALIDLTESQNNLMSVWFAYYAARMSLARQMGVMELDENGIWIDKPLTAAERRRRKRCRCRPRCRTNC